MEPSQIPMWKKHSHKSWEFTVFLHALWARHCLEGLFFIPGNINADCKTLKYNITRFCYSFIVFVVKPPSACKWLTHKYCHKSYILLKVELSCYFNLVVWRLASIQGRNTHFHARGKSPLYDTYMFLGSAGAQKELWHSLSNLAVLWMDFARSPCFFKEISFSLYWPSRGAVLCAQATAFVYRRHKRHIFLHENGKKIEGESFSNSNSFSMICCEIIALENSHSGKIISLCLAKIPSS